MIFRMIAVPQLRTSPLVIPIATAVVALSSGWHVGHLFHIASVEVVAKHFLTIECTLRQPLNSLGPLIRFRHSCFNLLLFRKARRNAESAIRYFVDLSKYMFKHGAHLKSGPDPRRGSQFENGHVVKGDKCGFGAATEVRVPVLSELREMDHFRGVVDGLNLAIELANYATGTGLDSPPLKMVNLECLVPCFARLPFTQPIGRSDRRNGTNCLNPSGRIRASHWGVGPSPRGEDKRQHSNCANKARQRECGRNGSISGDRLNFHAFSAAVPRHLSAAEGGA